MVGVAEHLSPRHQAESELNDRQLDAILVEPAQGEIGRSGVLGGADAVLAAGAATVPKFEILHLAAGGIGGERSLPKAVGIGEPQLRAGMRAFLPEDHSHPVRHVVRSRRPVASMTQAPSRTCTAASTATDQALAGPMPGLCRWRSQLRVHLRPTQ